VRLPNPGKHLYPPPLTPIDAGQFAEHHASSPDNEQMAQLYVHLPFCETICTFCPIHKSKLLPTSNVSGYVNAVIAELEAVSRLPFIQGLRFDNVYFGGGTPSVIPDPQLGALVNEIRASFHLDDDVQMTFEGHISTLTREKVRFVRSLGFNRLSTGIQTFDPRLRVMLNLTPTESDIRRCIADARDEGFDDFNVDLMYNIPGQTLRIWERDLAKAASLEPSGLDLYETVISRATPLGQQIERGVVAVPSDPGERAKSYLLADQLLPAYGFRQRNLFVWDRAGFENRLVGSQAQLRDCELHVVGVGLSSYSLINGRSYMNETRRRDYIELVKSTRHGVRSFHECTTRERMERFMVMSLQDFAFERRRFQDQFDCDFEEVFEPQLRSFSERGLVEPGDDDLVLTRLGRAWASTMAIEFFGRPTQEEILRARIDGTFFISITYEEELELPVFAVFHPDVVLRDWKDFRLLARYIQAMRQKNRFWLARIARLVAQTARRWGAPAIGWYAALPFRSLLRAARCSPGVARRLCRFGVR
jgi:coproporphyrinogen III oxidase-like Fe-S oxidoreductase